MLVRPVSETTAQIRKKENHNLELYPVDCRIGEEREISCLATETTAKREPVLIKTQIKPNKTAC